MPETLRCDECGFALLGFRSRGPTPVGYDECPNCGGTAFSFESEE